MKILTQMLIERDTDMIMLLLMLVCSVVCACEREWYLFSMAFASMLIDVVFVAENYCDIKKGAKK